MKDCKNSWKLKCLLLCLMICSGAWGQGLDPSSYGRGNTTSTDYDPLDDRQREPQEQRAFIPDTFGVFEFQVDNPNEEIAFKDSILPGFAVYDQAELPGFDYAHLGIVGSPAYALKYRPRGRRGLDFGFHQFDLYQRTGSNLDFYRLQRPYTNLRYLRGSNANDTYIEANFSRNFADGISFVIDHARWRQFGTQDQYPQQRLLNNSTSGGFWIHPEGSRYQAFVSHAANTYEQQWNGGVSVLPDDDGQFSTPQSAEVLLNDTEIRHVYREWMLTQYYQFGGRTDSSGQKQRAFTLSHQLRYDRRNFRLAASYLDADTSFYNRFPDLLIDDRGQRSGIIHTVLENSFRLSTFRAGKSASGEGVQKDLLEVGMTHQLQRYDQGLGLNRSNHLLLHGKLGFRPSDALRLLLFGQLEMLGQTGDYRLEADGQLDLGKAGQLELSFLNQLYSPTLVQQEYVLTGELLWDNDFFKTLETRISGAYTVPGLKVKAELAYTLINDLIYYDESGLPQQNRNALSLLQLSLARDFNFGALQLNNRAVVQLRDDETIRLPRIMSEHSLFYNGKWFKVLDVNLGADVRILGDYRPYYFNPLVQQFQLSDSENIGTYVQIDPFFSMRVTRFRFFARYIMLNTVIGQNPQLLFATADYPYPDAALRIGISWRLID